MTDNWKIATIGDVCDVVNGGTPKTGVSEYWGGLHQWITPAEMGKRATPYIDRTARTITDQGLQNSSARPLPPYSVILSSRAPIGHLVINTEPMATNQGCKGLVPSRKVDHKFLYYYLCSKVELLNDLGTGTTFKELSGGKLKEVQIPVPPLSEQRRIVAILDEAFEAIATAKANSEKNLQSTREILGNHLSTVFSSPQETWLTKSLGDSVRFIDYRGKTPPKRDEGIRLITAKNVKMGYIQRAPEEFIDSTVYDEWMTRGFPKPGDVLFTTEAPLGNVAQLDTDEIVVIGQRLITMQPFDETLDRTFLKYALMSPPIQAAIHAKGTGATVLGIKASLLKMINIWYPRDVGEQEEIVSRITDVESDANRLAGIYERKMAALDELKKSLLHNAFTGQLTANKAEDMVEAVA